MGAEGAEERTETKPNPISEAQFLSWKRRKHVERRMSGRGELAVHSVLASFAHRMVVINMGTDFVEDQDQVCWGINPSLYMADLTYLYKFENQSLTPHLEVLHRQDAEASARKAEAARKRTEDIAAGTVQMNGRELFQHEPWVFDNTQY